MEKKKDQKSYCKRHEEIIRKKKKSDVKMALKHTHIKRNLKSTLR